MFDGIYSQFIPSHILGTYKQVHVLSYKKRKSNRLFLVKA